MQFMVLGYDGLDEGAPARRLAVREAHLGLAEARFEQGEFLYACAILDEEGRMRGSMIVCEFPSRPELDHWLKTEPYVIGNVWKKIEVLAVRVAPFCARKA